MPGSCATRACGRADLIRFQLSSFTGHSPNLRKALHVGAELVAEEPRLADILDILAWSGSSAMGLDLLAALLDLPPDAAELVSGVGLGVELHLLRWDDRIGMAPRSALRMHRLIQEVRRDETPHRIPV